MVILETERLILRPFEESDLDAYHAVLANPEVGAWLGKPEGFSREAAEANLKEATYKWKDGFSALVVILKSENKLIGHCGLVYREKHGAFELLYAIDSPYWKQGYTTEAAKVCIDYGFKELKLEKIIAFTQPHNLGSRRVMEKHGFKYTKDFIHAELPHVFYELHAN